MKHIMSPPKKKFDLKSVKELIGNVGRKLISNPRLSLAFAFLLTVFLAVSLILAFKLGQESSETKGSQGRCMQITLSGNIREFKNVIFRTGSFGSVSELNQLTRGGAFATMSAAALKQTPCNSAHEEHLCYISPPGTA